MTSKKFKGEAWRIAMRRSAEVAELSGDSESANDIYRAVIRDGRLEAKETA